MSQRHVALITDTTACIPREHIERYRIEIVPARIVIDEKIVLDTIDITAAQFYSRLRSSSTIPRSLAPSIESYLEAITRAAKRASHIICVMPPAIFSSLSEAERSELVFHAERLSGNKTIFLSGPASAAGQGLTVIAMARAAADGLSYDRVTRVYHSVSNKVHMFAAPDTLDYLAKSGRVPNFASIAGSLLNIKPVLHINGTDIKPVAYPISMEGAINRMVKAMQSGLHHSDNLRIAIMHADAFKTATLMKEAILERFTCLEWFITEFTPVMGVHTGPGLVGVAYFTDDNA